MVAHVSVADPVCARLGDALEAAGRELGLPLRRAGTYMVMEGPQFSTRAESQLYRSWGCDVVGMTNMPEAKLAREAELCYATVAMVTDYDCWHDAHAHVTVDPVVRTLFDNADKARALVRQVVPRLSGRHGSCAQGCHHALDAALITAPEARDPARSEEHTSELQSLMRISYAVFCLKKKRTITPHSHYDSKCKTQTYI